MGIMGVIEYVVQRKSRRRGRRWSKLKKNERKGIGKRGGWERGIRKGERLGK